MSAGDNKKISELAAAGTLTGAELIELVQSGTNVQSTIAAITDAISGTWTPSLTFSTPGNLSVSFAGGTQLGVYYRVGNWVTLFFSMTTTTFTHTTASGNLFITGNPFTAKTVAGFRWNGILGQYQGITKANFTSFAAGINSAGVTMSIGASGSAQTSGNVTAADMPTGTVKIIIGSVGFPV